MSGFDSHHYTHDGHPLFYGRPMDDLNDYECQVYRRPVLASELLRSICCILLTAGGLFFELIMPPLAWPGLAWPGLLSKHPNQPETQPSAFDTERMGREPYAKRTQCSRVSTPTFLC
ncbi:hypothetical protein MVEG_08442 [Podila verticillata NRRL 6337]|nr:hypothetical protein MVEG_08442 [Podila verticillata NRRL 6337]